MKKATVTAAIMVMLLLAHWAQGGVSMVRNGSFENDGVINPITEEYPPQYWCDVNLPVDKFGGWVSTDWKPHGGYSLTFYSGFATFTAGDMALVSQQVYLTDVNEIIFDVRLGTIGDYPWDPNERSAVLLIDGNVVWDSNTSLGPNADGEYLNQTVDVNQIYKDVNSHTLSLAMKANKGKTEWFYEYLVQWDFVKFDTHCGGFGYLPEDLNHDCYVDFLDFAMLAGQWRAEELNEEYDLFQDDDDIVNLRDFAIFASYWRDNNCRQSGGCGGSDFDRSGMVDSADLMIFAEYWLEPVVALLSDLNKDRAINFKDVAIFAGGWLDNTDWKNWQDDNCFEIELPAGDLNDDGIVNLRDFAVLTGDWMNRGRCIRSDIDGSGVVDYGDISKLTEQWLEKSWLYGLK